MRIRQFLVFLFFTFGSLGYVLAQDVIVVLGSVRDKESSQKLVGASVIVTRDGVEYDSETTSKSGRFEFELSMGYRYNFKFSKNGYVHKIIQIDSKNIPAEDMEGGFEFPLEVTLFEIIEGMDMTIFDAPIGKAAFDSGKNSIEFDAGYTAIMQQKITDELDRLEDLEFNKKKLQKDFDLLVERGDDKAAKERYPDAISKYNQALKIFPTDEVVLQKIADVQAKIDAANAYKASDAEYARYISDANSFMKNEDWQKAKSKYEKALTIKPDESLPKDKIREIDKLLENLMNRDNFNDLVDQGDRKMQSEDYALAIKKYEEALKLIPTDEYPRTQIALAQKKIDDLLLASANAEELEKKYNEKMAIADDNFAKKRFTEARDLYVQAKNIKPEETRPVKQIEAIDAILGAESEQASKDADREDDLKAKRELDAKYQKALDEANILYNASDLEEAKKSYELALTIKPNEQFPKSKIQDIDRRLEKLAENALKDTENNKAQEEEDRINAEYQALIDEAADLLDNDEWEASIAKYEKSLLVKPSEKLPKSKIAYIKKLIKDSKNKVSDNDHMAELERRRRAGELEIERLKQESEAMRADQLSMLDKQRQEQEEEAKIRKADRADSNGRKGGLVSEVDTSRERELDSFYQDAKINSETAKGKKVNAKRDENTRKLDLQSEDARRRREDQSDEIAIKQDQIELVFREGEETRNERVNEEQIKQAGFVDNGKEEQSTAERRRENTVDKIEDKKEEIADRSDEVIQREKRIAKSESIQSDFVYKNEINARQGETGRLDNKNEVERKQDAVKDAPNLGKEVREVKTEVLAKKSENYQKSDKDTDVAAKSRQATFSLGIDERKRQQSQEREEHINLSVADNEAEIQRKEEIKSSSHEELRLAAKLRRLEELEKRKIKTEGSSKEEQNIRAPEGSSDIPEGITETSYKIGDNKDVIERTVKIGNKVDVYRKVVSKYGTAYFKNGSSITQQMWKQNTVKVTD